MKTFSIYTYLLGVHTRICTGATTAHLHILQASFQLINPAVVGTQGGTYVNLSLRNQWVGIDEALQPVPCPLVLPTRTTALALAFLWSMIGSTLSDKRLSLLIFLSTACREQPTYLSGLKSRR